MEIWELKTEKVTLSPGQHQWRGCPGIVCRGRGQSSEDPSDARGLSMGISWQEEMLVIEERPLQREEEKQKSVVVKARAGVRFFLQNYFIIKV